MPRYYFHLHGPEARLEDEEGLVLPDREAAWYQAVRSAREMIRTERGLGTSWGERSIEIADAAGYPVDCVPLDAILSYTL